MRAHLPPPTQCPPASGFTLVELLVTMTISAIMLALAAPNLTELLQRQGVASVTDTLAADLKLARSEAIKRGAQVTLCGVVVSTTAGNTTASCAAAPAANSTANWTEQGWMVVDTANNTVIKRQATGFGVGAVLASPASDGGFTFNPTGIMSGTAGNVLIQPANTSHTKDQQRICIGSTGRPRVIKGDNSSCT